MGEKFPHHLENEAFRGFPMAEKCYLGGLRSVIVLATLAPLRLPVRIPAIRVRIDLSLESTTLSTGCQKVAPGRTGIAQG